MCEQTSRIKFFIAAIRADVDALLATNCLAFQEFTLTDHRLRGVERSVLFVDSSFLIANLTKIVVIANETIIAYTSDVLFFTHVTKHTSMV